MVYTFGAGSAVSAARSAAGMVKTEAVIAAVLLKEDGGIADAVFDAVESRIPVPAGAIAGTSRTTVFQSQRETREFYGENSDTALWCRKADVFRQAVLGRTMAEIKAWKHLPVEGRELSFGEDAALLTLRTALEKAVTDCPGHLFEAKDCAIRLVAQSKADPSSQSASGEKAGNVCVNADFAAMALETERGNILAAVVDRIQPRTILFADGNIGETTCSGSFRVTAPESLPEITAILGRTENELPTAGEGLYWALLAKAARFRRTVTVNTCQYTVGEKITLPLTNPASDRFVAIQEGERFSYRMLTEEEREAGQIELTTQADQSVKFYRYGLFIDDRCVIAGDTNYNRILLSDYLSDDYESYYCFGYDTVNGEPGTDSVGCMCATNDLWKVFHTRYIYTGYYQVAVTIADGKTVRMENNELAFQAAPIPDGAVFPFCDADGPKHLAPVSGGRKIVSGTYYVKKGTTFTDGAREYVVTENGVLDFS